MSLQPLRLKRPGILAQPGLFPAFYDISAFILIIAILALAALGIEGMNQPLTRLQAQPISLALGDLPKYALYTTLRMFAAIMASLVFTFIAATAAAKNRKAETLIIPALDILQSVPVLGFLTFTVPFFMGLFPGYQAGVELAAIFAIFTSQAWNMAFSFYQSLRAVPHDLSEVSDQFMLNGWQKFWRLEVPYAIPGLVWNTMMSMSGGWFFVVASEAISVGKTQIALPGIGSWLAVAIADKNFIAVAWAVLAMGIVILLYDQIIFRPIVAWSDKFNMGQTASQHTPKSWVYNISRRSRALDALMTPLRVLGDRLLRVRWVSVRRATQSRLPHRHRSAKIFDGLWTVAVFALIAWACVFLVKYLHATVSMQIVDTAFLFGLFTAVRVVVLIALASLIWVPVGVWVGLRPGVTAWIQPIAQFMAAFPANILFPIFVVVIVRYHLSPDIWLSPLMILGTQWYILFNVIAGASAFPNDLKETAGIYHLGRWLWWRKVMLPGIMPYYITGALTASGGSWNASIVAEVANWGSTRLQAHGLGAFIANATEAGDFHQVVLGIAVMSIFVLTFNRLVWRRLYAYAANRLRLD